MFLAATPSAGGKSYATDGKYNHGLRVEAHIRLRISGATCSHEFLNRTTAMTATIIESHDFQRQIRINHLVRFTMAMSGFCVAVAGIASAIITLVQM